MYLCQLWPVSTNDCGPDTCGLNGCYLDCSILNNVPCCCLQPLQTAHTEQCMH
jgi:hypothetical protein